MIITCERCATQFQLDDAKVPASGIRVRCSRCEHSFVVESSARSDEDCAEDLAHEALVGEDADAEFESDWGFNDDGAISESVGPEELAADSSPALETGPSELSVAQDAVDDLLADCDPGAFALDDEPAAEIQEDPLAAFELGDSELTDSELPDVEVEPVDESPGFEPESEPAEAEDLADDPANWPRSRRPQANSPPCTPSRAWVPQSTFQPRAPKGEPGRPGSARPWAGRLSPSCWPRGSSVA